MALTVVPTINFGKSDDNLQGLEIAYQKNLVIIKGNLTSDGTKVAEAIMKCVNQFSGDVYAPVIVNSHNVFFILETTNIIP